MKKSVFCFLTSIVFSLIAIVGISAQGDKPQVKMTVDQRLQAAIEENNKLKRLKQIEAENKKLREDLGLSEKSTEPVEGTRDPDSAVEKKADSTTDKTLENTDAANGAKPVTRDDEPVTSAPVGADAGNSAAAESATDAAKTPIVNLINRFAPKKTTDVPMGVPVPAAVNAARQIAIDPDKPCGQSNPSEAQKKICSLAVELIRNSPDARNMKYRPNVNAALFATVLTRLISADSGENAILASQALRNDKQVGSNSQSSGTTSLVAKGGIPMIMSLATENGAAGSSVSGTTITYIFNPMGTLEFLSNGSTLNFRPQPPPDDLAKFLRRTAIGISFDTSRGVPTPQFTGSRDQFSGLSLRYEFANQRDPTSEEAQKLTQQFVRTSGTAFTDAAVTALEPILFPNDQSQTPASIKLITNGVDGVIADNAERLNTVSGNERAEMLYEILKKQFGTINLDTLKSDKVVATALQTYSNASSNFDDAFRNLQRRLKKGTLFTFDYNYTRTFTASDTSNFRMIYQKGWGNGADFTFNSDLTMFHRQVSAFAMPTPTMPTERQKGLRDFSFASQLDVPLSGLSGLGGLFKDSTFSLLAKYRRINTDAAVLKNGIGLTGIRGGIWFGQAKMDIPIGETGFNLPLSFTYSNRTDLIKEKKSRGNFGFTFDLSSLLQRWNPFGPKP